MIPVLSAYAGSEETVSLHGKPTENLEISTDFHGFDGSFVLYDLSLIHILYTFPRKKNGPGTKSRTAKKKMLKIMQDTFWSFVIESPLSKKPMTKMI